MPLLLRRLLILLIVSVGRTAWAAPGDWEMCRNGLWGSDPDVSIHRAVIIGTPKEAVHFFDDNDGCPGAPRNGAVCQSKSYLIPGDTLLVGREDRGWICGYYRKTPTGRDFAGWIQADHVRLLDTPPPRDTDWLGTWRDGDNQIIIRRGQSPATFQIEGDAVWYGAHENVHVGSVSGAASPNGAELTITEGEPSDYACRVHLRLVGDRLIANDNSQCGGMNVRFNGVYMRGQKQPSKAAG